jgi:uncharacterized protein YyaL (SSP411 family)
MANHLADETSPYLLQHAHNPVDWYPWGAAAFERARFEDKPILLSVGYSACHWCHVMERESFENAAAATLMNELFVSVKVDREERPDVDSIYMQAVQAMLGHGGWPMTVFLTPELEPFWGGTYFPPHDRPGMPSFQRVLRAVRAAYDERPDDVQKVASSMREMFAGMARAAAAGEAITRDMLLHARHGLLANLDEQFGGFGSAPKFPHTMALEFLLTQWARHGDPASLDAARSTFLRMARGGIYDQLGGGFARYSVDERWLVPHFEKMLYDNALLVRLGVHLWQATRDTEVRRVVTETLEWLQREMTSPTGGFYSTLDADSEGEEGKFYVWSDAEVRELLAGDAEAAVEYWGITPGGNFEGHNILHVAGSGDRSDAVARARATLLRARAERVRPARDDKILASWNGLMLRGVAEAARAFGSTGLRELAIRNGEFLFAEMVRDGRVFRSHKDGRSRIGGFLEDYAAVALGALALYELTFDTRWLDRARLLADSIVRWFWDDASNAFFDSPSDAESLLTRARDTTDNATPSGTALATELLLRLGDLFADAEFTGCGRRVLNSMSEQMTRFPLAFGHSLTAADLVVYGAVEVALAGDIHAADFIELARPLGETFVPSLIVAGGAANIALLKDRPTRGDRATAYVCRGYVCDEPTTAPQRLTEQLARAAGTH